MTIEQLEIKSFGLSLDIQANNKFSTDIDNLVVKFATEMLQELFDDGCGPNGILQKIDELRDKRLYK